MATLTQTISNHPVTKPRVALWLASVGVLTTESLVETYLKFGSTIL